eukprot:TRINITY_DN6972_c0_g1_i1.p1 TRINITY_DN6972_c0_g1~~TRINITY_DN6972_c0_g1_i1.p1  ORF type:complete len:354 (+),score=72.18 TRINITY_DN6972_c0_g1_i1:128-1063(+)
MAATTAAVSRRLATSGLARALRATCVVGALRLQQRCFGTTDGPFRHLKPRFTERKKHYNEVLVMADRRKLLETAQDLLAEVPGEVPKPRAFWEVLSKRCVQSMHLLAPLEVAIVLRALDNHGIQLRGADVFAAAAPCVESAREVPGHAVAVFADIFPRRLHSASPVELQRLLAHVGRCAADALWELSPRHAADLLGSLTAAGVRDSALSARVARKVLFRLQAEAQGEAAPADPQDPDVEPFGPEELAAVAETMVGQEHRDLPLLRALAQRIVEGPASAETAACAARVLASFRALQVDDVPGELENVAAGAA